jgi:transposase
MESARTQRRFTLSEKMAIVRESLMPGVSATHVARRHKIAVNVLYYWRKAYKEVLDTDLTKLEDGAAQQKEIADLKLQVRNLERLLGQRTLEVALLRQRLGKGRDDEEEF